MFELFVFALIGVFAGLSAGLLGLGGGLVTVPALLVVFSVMDMHSTYAMHIAVTTSLMAIIFTSISSMLAHHKRQNINWHLIKILLPGLWLGGLIGAYFATLLSSELLQRCFAVYALLMSIRLWVPMSISGISTSLLKSNYLLTSGSIFGAISALVGMGGGTMVVPYLVMARLPIQKAIGTSAACAFPISVSAIIGFMVFGQQISIVGEWQTGFIDWKAVLSVTSTSVLCAPLGAKLAAELPIVRLRQVFAVVLLLVSIDLFFS